MDGMTPGEEIAEHAYKRWWITSNRDAYTGSVMREVGREAYEVGRRAGREDAAREIHADLVRVRDRVDDKLSDRKTAACLRVGLEMAALRVTELSDGWSTSDLGRSRQGVGDNTEEQQQGNGA